MKATMDGNRSKPDFNFPAKKCGRGVNGGVDRVSELPDEIRIKILSFLPLKDAARTNILSRQWSDLWKHSPNLKFTDGDNTLKMCSRIESIESSWEAEKCKCVGLVNSILQSHKSPFLKQFIIDFYVNKSAHSQVAKWLEFVFLKGVERLELNFHCYRSKYRVVLEKVLRESGLSRPQNPILFKSLKSLCLNHMKVSGEAISLILLNCPLLEELIIHCVSYKSDVEVRGNADLMLKRLSLYGFGMADSLRISAPNLTFFGVESGPSVNLLLENVPKLAEADLRFSSGKLNSGPNVASVLSCLSSQLQILSLTLLYHHEDFLAKVFPQMPNLKKLVVKANCFLHITDLIWASPLLQEFELEFQEVENTRFKEGKGNGERSPHQHLKVFKVARLLDGSGEAVKLVNYVLDNCVALQKIIVCCGPSSVMRFPSLRKQTAEGFLIRRLAENQTAKEYAKRQLQGRVPQHIQLQII